MKRRTPARCFVMRRMSIVPALRDLQRAVYRSLMERDGGGMATCVRDDGIAAVDRLSVYRNTFYGTLTNALRLSYPAVHRLVAAEFFEAVAQAFIGAQPPRSAYLDEYGSGFPDFLARFPAATSVPYLFDVARGARAPMRSFHARSVGEPGPRKLSGGHHLARGP